MIMSFSSVWSAAESWKHCAAQCRGAQQQTLDSTRRARCCPPESKQPGRRMREHVVPSKLRRPIGSNRRTKVDREKGQGETERLRAFEAPNGRNYSNAVHNDENYDEDLDKPVIPSRIPTGCANPDRTRYARATRSRCRSSRRSARRRWRSQLLRAQRCARSIRNSGRTRPLDAMALTWKRAKLKAGDGEQDMCSAIHRSPGRCDYRQISTIATARRTTLDLHPRDRPAWCLPSRTSLEFGDGQQMPVRGQRRRAGRSSRYDVSTKDSESPPRLTKVSVSLYLVGSEELPDKARAHRRPSPRPSSRRIRRRNLPDRMYGGVVGFAVGVSWQIIEDKGAHCCGG